MRRHIILHLLFISAISLPNQGCVSTPRRMSAVPAEITAKAEIPAMPGIRFVAGGDMQGYFAASIAGQQREQAYRKSQGITGNLPPAVFLAVSGGGDQSYPWLKTPPAFGAESAPLPDTK